MLFSGLHNQLFDRSSLSRCVGIKRIFRTIIPGLNLMVNEIIIANLIYQISIVCINIVYDSSPEQGQSFFISFQLKNSLPLPHSLTKRFQCFLIFYLIGNSFYTLYLNGLHHDTGGENGINLSSYIIKELLLIWSHKPFLHAEISYLLLDPLWLKIWIFGLFPQHMKKSSQIP